MKVHFIIIIGLILLAPNYSIAQSKDTGTSTASKPLQESDTALATWYLIKGAQAREELMTCKGLRRIDSIQIEVGKSLLNLEQVKHGETRSELDKTKIELKAAKSNSALGWTVAFVLSIMLLIQ